MSDSNPPEEPKIIDSTPDKTTTTKPENIKDPKRVAAGKRLTEIPKAAKERKMRERIEEEKKLEGESKGFSFDLKYLYHLAGLAIVGLSLYYNYRPNQREVKAMETIKKEVEGIRTVVVKKSASRKVNTLDSLD